jgi:hypothetical protein
VQVRKPLLVGLVASVVATGCVTVGVGSNGPTSKPESFEPAPSLATVARTACTRTSITGQLASDPRDPRVAWLETFDGRRVEVVWPTGYTGRFIDVGDEIVLEVSDERGRIFMGTHASPPVTCAAGLPDTVLLMQTSP